MQFNVSCSLDASWKCNKLAFGFYTASSKTLSLPLSITSLVPWRTRIKNTTNLHGHLPPEFRRTRLYLKTIYSTPGDFLLFSFRQRVVSTFDIAPVRESVERAIALMHLVRTSSVSRSALRRSLFPANKKRIFDRKRKNTLMVRRMSRYLKSDGPTSGGTRADGKIVRNTHSSPSTSRNDASHRSYITWCPRVVSDQDGPIEFRGRNSATPVPRNKRYD